MSAIKAVPWALLLKNAPQIVKAADALAGRLRARDLPSTGDHGAHDVEALESRVAALEEHDRSDAAVLRQMAEQIEALTTNTVMLAARVRTLGFVAIALAVALVLLLIYVLLGP
jgi:hypothetical protein